MAGIETTIKIDQAQFQAAFDAVRPYSKKTLQEDFMSQVSGLVKRVIEVSPPQTDTDSSEGLIRGQKRVAGDVFSAFHISKHDTGTEYFEENRQWFLQNLSRNRHWNKRGTFRVVSEAMRAKLVETLQTRVGDFMAGWQAMAKRFKRSIPKWAKKSWKSGKEPALDIGSTQFTFRSVNITPVAGEQRVQGLILWAQKKQLAAMERKAAFLAEQALKRAFK